MKRYIQNDNIIIITDIEGRIWEHEYIKHLQECPSLANNM